MASTPDKSAFWQFVAQWKQLVGAGAIAAPWFAHFIPITPPWPSPIVSNGLVLIFQAMIFTLAYALWQKALLERVPVLVMPLVLALVLGLTYYQLTRYLEEFKSSVVTFEDESDQPAFIIGDKLLPEVQELHDSDPSKWTRAAILDYAGRQPELAWTAESIDRNAVALVSAWVAFWTLLFAFISVSVSYFTPNPAIAAMP